MRRLVGIPHSPWSLEARWALDHHGIEYEFEVYTPMVGEPVLRSRMGWPRGPVTVPVLFDADEVLGESLEIARRADRIGAGPPLFPEGVERDVLQWAGLADVVCRAGRALMTPRLIQCSAALEESMPPWIPPGMRRVALPAADLTVRYIARKHGVRPEEAEQNRGTIRWALAKLRSALERSEHVCGVPSFADVAMVCALQMVKPAHDLAPLGPASRTVWTDDALAREHEDLLAWRDRYLARVTARPRVPTK